MTAMQMETSAVSGRECPEYEILVFYYHFPSFIHQLISTFLRIPTPKKCDRMVTIQNQFYIENTVAQRLKWLLQCSGDVQIVDNEYDKFSHCTIHFIRVTKLKIQSCTMPVVQCNQTFFAYNPNFEATNAPHVANGQAFGASLYASNQPLHQSAPHPAQKQQTPSLLTCSSPARPSLAAELRIQADDRKQVLNKSLVLDHNVYKYPKKNAQSNLINQVVSYLSIQSKSLKPLLTIFNNNQDKTHLFFTLMRQVKRQSKKYINRGYLKDLLMIQKSHIIHGILQKNKIEPLLTLQELQSALRRIVFHFLMQKSAMTVLTSSKLDRFSMKEHLQRRREVIEYLRYHLNHHGEEEQSQH